VRSKFYVLDFPAQRPTLSYHRTIDKTTDTAMDTIYSVSRKSIEYSMFPLQQESVLQVSFKAVVALHQPSYIPALNGRALRRIW
jgi:hypothetical protein